MAIVFAVSARAMMRSGDVVVTVAPDLTPLVAVPNKMGDVFAQFAAEVAENIEDEFRHRIPKESEIVKHPYLSAQHFEECSTQREALGEELLVCYQPSKDLIKKIMEWLPARDESSGSTEKKLRDFGGQVPLFFHLTMSRDEVVVCIPNPYGLNTSEKSVIQQLIDANPAVEKRIMMRPGASVEGPVNDETAILLFRYVEA